MEHIQSIFPTPIAFYYNHNKDLLTNLRDKVLELEKTQETQIDSKVAVTLKHNLSESDFNFLDNNETNIQQLKRFFIDSLLDTASVVNDIHKDKLKVEFVDSWYHVTRKGGYHEVHSHGNCSWCGIFYVDKGFSEQEEPTGLNKFLTPVKASYVDLGNIFLDRSTCMKVIPENGKLILFPNYLDHYATPYEGDRERILISFNARIKENEY